MIGTKKKRPSTSTTGRANTSPKSPSEHRGGALVYWGLPVVIGLALGAGVVGAIRFLPEMFKSEARRIVDDWRWADYEHNEKLVQDLRGLGPSARADIHEAFGDLSDESPEMRVWVGEQLGREPWFDTTSLKEDARSADEWTRRTAATALALVLGEQADPDIVLPGILDWLSDLTIDDHSLPLQAVQGLGLLPPKWNERVRKALVELVKKRPPLYDDPEQDWTPDDRDMAIGALSHGFLPDVGIEKLLAGIVLDESDDEAPRIGAVRALSANQNFDDVEMWRGASKSSNRVVRQAAAENLFRTKAPEFDSVLEPLHRDPHSLVRLGSVDTQIARGRATMLPVIDELLEDSDEWLRFAAGQACGAFDKEPGWEARRGMLLWKVEHSDEQEDVMGAVLALVRISDEVFGLPPIAVQVPMQDIEKSALATFMKDSEGRADATAKWRQALEQHEKRPGVTEWTDADRHAVLRKLLSHPDPENVERARALLDAAGVK